MNKPPKPLLMTEEYWANSQLYLAECSALANKEGRDKAIEPGEPADLIWDGLQKDYKRLGRDTILRLLKEGKSFEEIHLYGTTDTTP